MKLLIKIGGGLLDEPLTRQRIAAEIADIGRDHEVVVVHGGGKQLTRFLEAQGVQSAFVNGMRVSDPAVIDALTKVIAGSVNKALVCALNAAGAHGLGLSGVDGLLTIATQLDPALQLVGRPQRSDGSLLNLLVNAGYVPAIACIAGDEHGAIFNVNADQMAVSVAEGWQADTLLFLTDVPGVKNASGEIEHVLDSPQIPHLIDAGVAHGGMQAKLEAAELALSNGVEEVVIAPGIEPGICRRVLAGEPIGTRLYLGRQEAAHK